MTVRNLQKLFRPQSVAVIGASDRPGTIGSTVMRNLLSGGFTGRIAPVNPRRSEVAAMRCFPNVASLDFVPDLAVVATPPQAVPGVIAELGAKGTRAAAVLTAGLSGGADETGRSLKQEMLDAARPHTLRILGPNCVGLLVPPLKLNASFSHVDALPGKLAFVSQSGALTTALLDWARGLGVGFSHFISLGDCADVDFGDTIDYLSSDPSTRAILLYIESIRDARKFMTAARTASRNMPVIAVKVGRAAEGAKAALSHTGALAGSDEVYEAALARAGVLRVQSTIELFNAAETLARIGKLGGERLAILTNGGGPGVMATDALVLGGGKLAALSQESLQALDAVLPKTWSHGNPVDIIGDAPAQRYVDALKIVLEDPSADAVLFIHAPTAIVPSAEIARACAPVIRESHRKVAACWLGGQAVQEARQIFIDAGIPVYNTPEAAVTSFLHLVRFFHNQRLLCETPPSIPEDFQPDTRAAQAIVKEALARGDTALSEPDAKSVLAAYGIPVVATRVAHNVTEVGAMAATLGFPVAVKILSPDISHKSDVGGVALNLESEADAMRAAAEMQRRASELRPNARIAGFTVQHMVRRGGATELIVGATTDAVFGPVILFGEGGTAVEVIADRAVALPPLNMKLARELVERTRVAKLLAGYRDQPAADIEAVQLALIKVSQLMIDIGEIVDLDINPLLADANGVIALDARIHIAHDSKSVDRFAIRPYPKELEEWVNVGDWRVLLRPIRPEDEPQHHEMAVRTDPEDLRTRFFHPIRTFSHERLAGYTQIDYSRNMAFIASYVDADGRPHTLGVVRAMSDPDLERAEFAVLIRSDLKGKGLGYALMDKIIRYCKARGIRVLWGDVLAENRAMLEMGAALGFKRTLSEEPGIVTLTLPLQEQATGNQGSKT
jgi:acetyltransferase